MSLHKATKYCISVQHIHLGLVISRSYDFLVRPKRKPQSRHGVSGDFPGVMLPKQRLELRHAGAAIRSGLEARADVSRGRAAGLDGFEDRRFANAKAGAYLAANVAASLGR
jgi:hypothetical protein